MSKPSLTKRVGSYLFEAEWVDEDDRNFYDVWIQSSDGYSASVTRATCEGVMTNCNTNHDKNIPESIVNAAERWYDSLNT
jgi:hypothetical protein